MKLNAANKFKKTAIGIIPVDWIVVDFGKIASFKNGINYGASEEGENIKFLGVADFKNRTIINDISALNTVSLDKCPKDEDLLSNGDLVFVRSNGSKKLVGRCLVVFPNNEKLTYSGFTIRARLISDITTSFYLSLLIQHGILKKQLVKDARGTNISNLNQSILSNLKILLPPLPEQKAIADILSTWDEAIEKSERLIVEKEKRFKALVQELMYKNCVKWNHLKPSSIFNTVTEKNCPDEELLSVTQDRGVIPRNMLKGRVMSPAGSTASYKLIKRGDFAVSLRSFQGGIEYSNYQGIISPAYTILRAKIEINNDFYRLFFKSYIFIKKYLNLAVIGIRDGKQISIPDFLNIKIPSPPLPEQKQIAEILNVAQKEITLLKQLVEKYKEQKRGLMQKLLTGEWRVKVD